MSDSGLRAMVVASSTRLTIAGTAVLVAGALHVVWPAWATSYLVLLTAGAVLAWRSSSGSGRAVSSLSPSVVAGAILLGAVVNTAVLGLASSLSDGLKVTISLGYTALALSAAFAPTSRRWPPRAAPLLFIAIHAVLIVSWLMAAPPHIDVHVLLTEGSRAFIAGHNPYAMSYPNIYDVQDTLRFYGPGFVVNGEVPFGFPYPPISLLLALPAFALGDVRYTGLVLLTVLALGVLGDGRARSSRPFAVMLLCAPGAIWMMYGAWTETSIVTLLGFALWAIRRQRYTTAAVLLGLLFVSKQYFFVALPCLWMLRPLATRARVATFSASAAAATLPWLVADPPAFVRSLVGYQLAPPWREDSLSLVGEVIRNVGGADIGWLRVLPVAAGLLVATIYSRRSSATASHFATGLALSLLATVMLSKNAVLNYYFLVGGALLLAAWAGLPLQGAAVPEGVVQGSNRVDTGVQPTTTGLASAR
ncbi:glycosyltransferase 87 family protein [Lapillicoccus sp.]|uniref:glycosyltransferase 87 family protein n=1 Tax=Lapillicoccus sp. TaxID=1909287 RepID=UPI00398382B1